MTPLPADPAGPADPLDPLDNSKMLALEQHSIAFGYFTPLGENLRRGKTNSFLIPPGKGFSLIIGNIGPQGGSRLQPPKAFLSVVDSGTTFRCLF